MFKIGTRVYTTTYEYEEFTVIGKLVDADGDRWYHVKADDGADFYFPVGSGELHKVVK